MGDSDPNEVPLHRRLDEDTRLDKGIRFGCGTLVGLFLVGSFAMQGAIPNVDAFVGVALMFAPACGLFVTVKNGHYFYTLLRALRWIK